MSTGEWSFGDEIALFPLHTVLFPGGLLPLRIFESRYLDMVGRCLKAREGFGVVAIRAGSEIGEADVYAVGTGAEIVDFDRDERGLLGIVAVGTRRFEVRSQRRRDDGLYLGRVKWLEEVGAALPARHAALASLLETALAHSEAVGGADFASAGWVGHRLAEVLPLDLPTKQRLLEHEDPIARLDELGALVADLAE